MSESVEPLSDVWPGIQDDLKSGNIGVADIVAAVRDLGGEIHEPQPAAASDFANIAHQAPARIPGTNLHVRLPGAGRGLLQLAWTLYRYHQGAIDIGDSFNVLSAVEKLKRSFQFLDVASGEKCVYLAIGRATSRLGLFTKEYPTADQIAGVLRQSNDWCNGVCKFHKDATQAYDNDAVRSVLQILKTKGDGVVKDCGEDRWTVTF
jgi:hypothetical protein